MVTQGVLGVIGFSSGLAVAGGVIALLIALGVLSRYAGLTRTPAICGCMRIPYFWEAFLETG